MRSRRVTTVAIGMVLSLAPADASAAVGQDRSGNAQPWIAYQTSYHETTGFGPEGVWLIHADRTGDHQVGVGANGEQLLPDWSPDGGKLVFTTRGGEHEPLFEYMLSSGRARQLFGCDGSCLGDDEPAYSPDGRTVAFVRALGAFTEFGPSDCSLWLGDVATGRVRRLTDNHSCNREVMPRWSPDGTRLTYYRERFDPATEQAATAVFVLRIATGQETRLTEWGDDYGEPDWSPDGRWIVMASHTRCTRSRSAATAPTCSGSVRTGADCRPSPAMPVTSAPPSPGVRRRATAGDHGRHRDPRHHAAGWLGATRVAPSR